MIDRLLDLKKVLGTQHSAFLFGPRGVGKTKLSEKFLKPLPTKYSIDLLNIEMLRRYLARPEIFKKEVEHKIVENKMLTVLIDEIQKCPPLLDIVHLLIEQHKHKVRFLLTGSSARKLKRGGANLLAGRAWTLNLHPLTKMEIIHSSIPFSLSKILKFGTLPAVYLEENEPKRTLNAYVNTYLKEEIMQEAIVRHVEYFVRFLDFAGQMNGEPINFTAIARSCGISTQTAQEYFSILDDTLIAFRINGWSYSIRKQIQQAPKYYFFDCGVLNTLLGELSTPLRPGFRYGKLFETYVIQEMFRLNDYYEKGFRFYYWRTNTGLEVDVVLSRGPHDEPIAIEIKSQQAPLEKDFHGLQSFASENKGARLIALCQTPQAYTLGKIEVFPYDEGILKVLGIKIQ